MKIFKKKELKDADKKNMRLYHRSQKRICIEKEKEKSIVKDEKRESLEVFERSVEKEIYLTIEITINITNILYTKER